MSEDEWFPENNPAIRKNLLRVARLIEYGAELEPREIRLTLVECTKRPHRQTLSGLYDRFERARRNDLRGVHDV